MYFLVVSRHPLFVFSDMGYVFVRLITFLVCSCRNWMSLPDLDINFNLNHYVTVTLLCNTEMEKKEGIKSLVWVLCVSESIFGSLLE